MGGGLQAARCELSTEPAARDAIRQLTRIRSFDERETLSVFYPTLDELNAAFSNINVGLFLAC